jgi:hypothetical protein
MINIYLIVFILVVVFLISYKPGAGTMGKIFGFDEAQGRKKTDGDEIVEEPMISRDEISARKIDNIFGKQ